MGKGLDFAPIQKKLNEPEQRSDFNEFCRRMILKWYFRDGSEHFCEVPVFNSKSRCKNTVRCLADDRNIIIKKADKGSCIVILGRNDYLMEAEKQLSDKKFYQEVNNTGNIIFK